MSGKRKFSYIGQKFRQGTSSVEMLTFCASARDIHSWSGVPQKTERFHGGFQRALQSRYTKIRDYFNNGQASPTSVVIAFRQGALSVQELGYPEKWAASDRLSYKPDFVEISFELSDEDIEEMDLNTLRQQVSDMLKARLELSEDDENDGEPIEDENGEGDETEDENEEEAESTEAESEDAVDESDQEIDVGRSKLDDFYRFVSSDKEVEEWIKRTADSERTSSKHRTKDPELGNATPEQRLKYVLGSLLRPAMIVDGQHRVWGAYNSNRPSDITFTVNAIKDSDWIEQVFQFVVLNKLAKPISGSFLTSILNTSLTNSEVSEIETRLDKIGIKNTDRKIVKYLNHDERSPFFGIVSEPGEIAGVSNKGKLSDKGMIRLAKRWRSIMNRELELQMFYPVLNTDKKTRAKREWKKYETWIPFFYGFWDQIREMYEEDGIWEKRQDYHLLYIVTMHCMQDLFLESKSEADSRFDSVENFKEEVKLFFSKVPATFFQSWDATGLQSGDGPTVIKEAIKLFRKGHKLPYVQDESILWSKVDR